MISLTDEQREIVDAPLEPMSVIACAGSGKTLTAVHRLVEMRKRLAEHRGRIALLSFSNVAVDTFRKNYNQLAQNIPNFARSRVEIDTLDSFITTNVIRPHAARTMQCSQAPFLVTGNESFLKNPQLSFWIPSNRGGSIPIQSKDLHNVMVNIQNGNPSFSYRQYNHLIPINGGSIVAARLGAIGAYTHELGRYWTYRTLIEQPAILRAFAYRYPYILIDEAQDIGTSHQAILELLINAGSQISLIGDPHQGIYEFAGADGSFLSEYGGKLGVNAYALTCNYRSVPVILHVANNVSSRNDTSSRNNPDTLHGSYFIPYKKSQKEQLVDAFCAAVQQAELSIDKSAVLCRNRNQTNELAGNGDEAGQGIIKEFVLAAILRDKAQDYKKSFESVAGCIAGLLSDPPKNLVSTLIRSPDNPKIRAMRQKIWEFTRNSRDGLPSAYLVANTDWHSLLRQNVETLLKVLEADFGLLSGGSLGNKLANKNLPNMPLISTPDLVSEPTHSIRIDTVHQVKGESLDAVLYLSTEKKHIEDLLAGVDTELGRVGYVAITRARNLLWLAVPENALSKLKPALLKKGFVEAGLN